MKKQLFGFCAAICLFWTLVCPAAAAAEEVPFDAAQLPFDTLVSDGADLLTDEEEEALGARAWELTQKYKCAVYLVTLLSLGDMEVWEATEYLWQEYGMGYGKDQSGIVLLLSTEYRDYDIMAHGYGNVVFTDYGKEKMAEQFLDAFGQDDWYGGFSEYLDCCEKYLKLASEGEPFDVGSDRSPLLGIAVGVLVPIVIAFAVCSVFKSQMKTAKMQEAAQGYIDRQGLVLTGQHDRFTYTTESRRRVQSEQESGGTSVNSSGSSHHSGKF